MALLAFLIKLPRLLSLRPPCALVVEVTTALGRDSVLVNKNSKIFLSVSYWIEKREGWTFICVFSVLLFTAVPPQWPSEALLHESGKHSEQPYSQYKHVRAKSQGDSISKVSQGQRCRNNRTQAHAPYDSIMLNC